MKLHEKIGDTYIDINGVLRWKSNDQVPPEEIIEDFRAVDMISDYTANLSHTVRRAEIGEFLRQYREREKNRQPSVEELFEMRAAFGEGTEVVNIVTGTKIKL